MALSNRKVSLDSDITKLAKWAQRQGWTLKMSDWTVTYMFADTHLIGFDDVEAGVESFGGSASSDGEGNVFLTMHVSAATADAAQAAVAGDLRGIGISKNPQSRSRP